MLNKQLKLNIARSINYGILDIIIEKGRIAVRP